MITPTTCILVSTRRIMDCIQRNNSREPHFSPLQVRMSIGSRHERVGSVPSHEASSPIFLSDYLYTAAGGCNCVLHSALRAARKRRASE